MSTIFYPEFQTAKQHGAMASSDLTIPRCKMTLTCKQMVIDSDDITYFFLIIVMLDLIVAMMMKETYGAFDEMTKALC